MGFAYFPPGAQGGLQDQYGNKWENGQFTPAPGMEGGPMGPNAPGPAGGPPQGQTPPPYTPPNDWPLPGGGVLTPPEPNPGNMAPSPTPWPGPKFPLPKFPGGGWPETPLPGVPFPYAGSIGNMGPGNGLGFDPNDPFIQRLIQRFLQMKNDGRIQF